MIAFELNFANFDLFAHSIRFMVVRTFNAHKIVFWSVESSLVMIAKEQIYLKNLVECLYLRNFFHSEENASFCYFVLVSQFC